MGGTDPEKRKFGHILWEKSLDEGQKEPRGEDGVRNNHVIALLLAKQTQLDQPGSEVEH